MPFIHTGIGLAATFGHQSKADIPHYGDEQHLQDCLRGDCCGVVVLGERMHIAPDHSLESLASLDSSYNISQLAANDFFNQCNEQTSLLKHEIALCRAVPLITVPLQ